MIRIAYAEGLRAARNRKPYSANPYDRKQQPEHFLSWSEGHNDARVTRALECLS